MAVLIVPSLVMGHRRRTRQRAAASGEFDAFLIDAGWQSVEDDELCRAWAGAPFGFGGSPLATRVVRGAAGRRRYPAVAFDYSVSVGGDRAHYQICFLTLPTALPPLEVQPNSSARLEQAPTMTTIPVANEEFSRRFTVFGSDPAFAHDIVSPAVMTKLLGLPDCAWRIEGDTMLALAAESLSATWLRDAVAMLAMIADSIPDRVWRDHGLATSDDTNTDPSWTPPAPGG